MLLPAAVPLRVGQFYADPVEIKCRDAFTKTQRSKRSAERRCIQCVAAGSQQPAAAAAGAPARATGKVRVRDVKKHYGHLYEIPLQAYIDAEVAWSRNDYVSEEDVEAASDAWDARSIAHDIDTQWGAMPRGGAYKDSNHYWGPGEYDFY